MYATQNHGVELTRIVDVVTIYFAVIFENDVEVWDISTINPTQYVDQYCYRVKD